MTRRQLLLGAGILLGVGAVVATRFVAPPPPSWPPPAGVPQGQLASPPAGDVDTVALVRLIAAPEAYDGKTVRTLGFAHIEFEGDALYVHREDFQHSLFPNSVRLSVPDSAALQPFSDRYVIVEGVFVAPRKGDRRSGAIRAISRFAPMPNREFFERAPH